MARLACVNVPALPLQLLLRSRPDWAAHPAAVVTDARAQSPLLWINAAAWRQGVRTGMRHAAALSLCHGLRAEAVPARAVAAEVTALTGRLQRHTPHVEPSREEPGVFWLDGAGLGRLHPDPRHWADALATELDGAGLRASVVVGHDRFSAYAAARVTRGVGVFPDPGRERQAVRRVPLARLGLSPAARDGLAQLGIITLAHLLRLPPLGLLERFGAPVYRLHRLAAGSLVEGLEPVPEALPIRLMWLLDDPEPDVARLLFGLKARLPALLAELGGRRQALKALHLRLLLAGAPPRETVLRPAAPTRDPALLLDLVRLRLEALAGPKAGAKASAQAGAQAGAQGEAPQAAGLEAAVTGIELLVEGDTRELEQLSLLPLPEAQGLEAANRALARLRAEFGEGAVVRARLRAEHLPEAAYAWEPLGVLKAPPSARAGPRATSPSAASPSTLPPPLPPPMLVRRILAAPQPLPMTPGAGLFAGAASPLPAQALERALGRALAQLLPGGGALARLHGPYPLSGRWWATAEHRDYYFAEMRRGELLWLYRDRVRGHWSLQGRVE